MAPADDPSVPPLRLRIPTDARLRETVRLISKRVAAYVGYPEVEAVRIGQSVDEAVGTMMACAGARDPGDSIDLRFSTSGGSMEIRLRYQAGESPLTGLDLERGFGRSRNGGPAIEAIRTVMDRVEFGQDGNVAYCRLLLHLPLDA